MNCMAWKIYPEHFPGVRFTFGQAFGVSNIIGFLFGLCVPYLPLKL